MRRRHPIIMTVLLVICLLTACTASVSSDTEAIAPERSLPLAYANQFSVDFYRGGYALIKMQDGNRYLLVPESAPVPAGLAPDLTVLQQPLDHIYLAATSAMDMFRSLDCLNCIRLSGTDTAGWHIEEARQAMENGNIQYAGKYSAPDYELIFAEQCDLALESTMIYHTPAVKEQLEQLGVPVLVERSSYESHPLGRMEWIKLYGVLLGQEEAAEKQFQKAVRMLPAAEDSTGKTVAFFSVNTNGSVTVRKAGDYIARLIEMAGGQYIFSDLSDNENALSTVTMQMEAFYTKAKTADYMIYNSAIQEELHSIQELLSKSPLLADCKAVQEGHVWCTGKSLFQSTMGLGALAEDIHRILTEENPSELTYLHRLA